MRLFRRHRRKPETEVPADEAVASSRAVGGVANPRHPDQHTTTGTTPSGEFVSRVTGEDPGAAGKSGAERRAEHDRAERAEEERAARDGAKRRHAAGGSPERDGAGPAEPG